MNVIEQIRPRVDHLQDEMADQMLAEILRHGSVLPFRRHHPKRWALVAASAAFAAGVGATVINQGSMPAGPQFKYSAQVIEAAEQNPRYMLDLPGWEVRTVYGFANDTGTLAYENGEQSLEINWYPADSYDFYYKDRLDVSPPETTTVDGRNGALFTYSSSDFAVMLPPANGSFVELRAQDLGIPASMKGKAAFVALFGQVEHASVNEWLDSLPGSIVKPDSTDAALNKVLADIPLPPDFNRAPLHDLGVSDEYQFGAMVTQYVVCRWKDALEVARSNHYAPGEREALDAFRSVSGWQVLKEIDAGGDWTEAMYEFADTVLAAQTASAVELGEFCDEVN